MLNLLVYMRVGRRQQRILGRPMIGGNFETMCFGFAAQTNVRREKREGREQRNQGQRGKGAKEQGEQGGKEAKETGKRLVTVERLLLQQIKTLSPHFISLNNIILQ